MFVTGQAEVHRLCKKLRSTFPSSPEASGSLPVGGRKRGVVKRQKQDVEVDLDE